MLLLATALAANGYDRQVVTLKVTYQDWDASQPWVRTSPATRSAQAIVIDGALVTTAQVLDDATFVRVTKLGQPEEVPARVAWVDREANLAVVEVDAPGFYDGLSSVRLAKKPVTEGAVSIARWRDNQMEVTEGRFTRAATMESATGVLDRVGLRVSTALTGGGGAEPVFRGKELVGLAEAQASADLLVTPAAYLSGWLADYADDGATRPQVGSLGVVVQEIRTATMASWLGLDTPRGLLVQRVARGASSCGVLRPGDALLEVAGFRLDGEGNVQDPTYGLLYFEHLVSRYHAGETLPVKVLRDRAEVSLAVPLRPYGGASWLVPAGRLDPPPYLVAGGLVFRELGESYSGRALDLRIVSALWRTTQTPEQRRVVVMASVLADTYNLGYHNLTDLRVSSVNGRAVDSVSEVREAFQHPVDGFHVVKLWPNYRFNEIVLDAATFDEATGRIAAAYGVPEVYRAETPPPDLGPACE